MKKVRGQTVYLPTERIERRSVKDRESGCWNWVGAVVSNDKPYGRMTVGSRQDGTRRTVSAGGQGARVVSEAAAPVTLPFYILAWVCHSPVPFCQPQLAVSYYVSTEHFAARLECESAIKRFVPLLPLRDGDTIIAGCRQVQEGA